MVICCQTFYLKILELKIQDNIRHKTKYNGTLNYLVPNLVSESSLNVLKINIPIKGISSAWLFVRFPIRETLDIQTKRITCTTNTGVAKIFKEVDDISTD